MEMELLLFGVTKEIIGPSPFKITFEGKTVGDLRTYLVSKYDKLEGLNSLLIAVNSEYANDELTISSSDEIAIIPPVSGG